MITRYMKLIMTLVTATAGTLGYKEIKKTPMDRLYEDLWKVDYQNINNLVDAWGNLKESKTDFYAECEAYSAVYDKHKSICKQVGTKNELIHDWIQINNYNKEMQKISLKYRNDDELPIDRMQYEMVKIKEPQYKAWIPDGFVTKHISELTPEENLNSVSIEGMNYKTILIDLKTILQNDVKTYRKQNKAFNKFKNNFEAVMDLE